MKAPARSLSRALLALPSTALGGTERHTARLAAALAAAGVATTLALEPALETGVLRLLDGSAGVRLRPARIGWQPGMSAEANMDAQEAALAAALEATRPDILILPLPWPSHGLGLLRGATAAGVPVLAIHHLAPREPEPPLPAAAQAVIAALPQARLSLAAVSAPVAARVAAFLDVPPAAVAVVPNGVTVPPENPAARLRVRAWLRRQLGLPEQARLVVFAGRLVEAKGADLLPEIARRLRAACGATLVALGEGELRAPLAAMATDGALRLPGHVDDVPAWLLAADALLLPSRLEGCPLVFLEAAARRCPVIASGDALECYGEAAAGLAAVAPAGGIADLTAQAAVRLNDPAAARAAVEAAHRLAILHDEAAMLRRYFSLLRSALA